MSFAKWYDEQKQQQQTSAAISSTSMSFSSLFSPSASDESSAGRDIESQSLIENFSLSSMRSSLEAQLPQKIMGMNYQQRFQIFCISLLLSGIFFALGFFVGIPMLTIRPQKFALSFTCGSITFMSSFAILKGPYAHFRSMLEGDRIVFTVVYVGSMFLTLYLTFTAGGAKGYVLVLVSSGLQLLSLLWYLVTFIPGGSVGLKVLMQAMWTLLKPLMLGCAKFQAICIGRCVRWYASRFASSES